MSLFTRTAAAVAVGAVALAPSALALTPAHADAPVNPALPVASDPFYGLGQLGGVATPPADSVPGEILASRPVKDTLTDVAALLTGSGKTIPVNATQVLYRTRDELGRPSATVTTVIKPTQIAPGAKSKGIVAYLSYYDGLSSTCDPSYTLQDDAAGGEEAIIGALLESGYTVTVPDFEGETLDWAAGHEAGWSTLDAIRATESALRLPSSTKVATIGYSGGSIAGEWAAELQPTYATDVNLIGTAIGGVPVNLRHLVGYVDGTKDVDRDSWFGVIPAATVSLGRATGQDFSSLLSPYGQQVANDVASKCIGDFADLYPGKHLSDLVNPGVDFLDSPAVKPIADSLTMGKGHTPTAPMLMMNGRSSDGIGDGVMVADDVKALASDYCRRGVPVEYAEQAGLHSAVGQSFMLKGLTYLGKWFAGTATAADYNCARAVVQPPRVHVTLKGHSHGRQDVLVVRASKNLAGHRVAVFAAGHKKAVAHTRLAKNGRTTIKVADRNGRHTTRYRVVIAGMKRSITLR